MKTSDKNIPVMSVFNSGLEAVSVVIKNTGLGVSWLCCLDYFIKMKANKTYRAVKWWLRM